MSDFPASFDDARVSIFVLIVFSSFFDFSSAFEALNFVALRVTVFSTSSFILSSLPSFVDLTSCAVESLGVFVLTRAFASDFVSASRDLTFFFESEFVMSVILITPVSDIFS